MDLHAKVSTIMTKEVISIHPQEVMTKVAALFRSHRIHHLPVIDDDHKLIGIVSKEDYLLLCDHFTMFKKEKEEELNQRFLSSITVKDVMTKQVSTLHQNDPVALAVGIFKENMFKALPIVDDDQKLVGIITTYDLLNFAFHEPLKELLV